MSLNFFHPLYRHLDSKASRKVAENNVLKIIGKKILIAYEFMRNNNPLLRRKASAYEKFWAESNSIHYSVAITDR